MTSVYLGRLGLPTLGLCAAAGSAIVGPVPDAAAAVRICRPAVFGAVGEAKSEREAKRFALQNWVARAGQYGAAYASWRMANNKKLACKSSGNGVTRCQATANPCAISQTPRPQPLRPRPTRSRGIEA